MSIGHDPEHAPSVAASKQADDLRAAQPYGITIWFPNAARDGVGVSSTTDAPAPSPTA